MEIVINKQLMSKIDTSKDLTIEISAKKINFMISDSIREEIRAKGWDVQDTPTGTRIWPRRAAVK